MILAKIVDKAENKLPLKNTNIRWSDKLERHSIELLNMINSTSFFVLLMEYNTMLIYLHIIISFNLFQ